MLYMQQQEVIGKELSQQIQHCKAACVPLHVHVTLHVHITACMCVTAQGFIRGGGNPTPSGNFPPFTIGNFF